MSTGNFSCSELAEVQLLSDSIWANSANRKDFIANVGALTAVRKEQTVRISALEDPLKDNTVKLIWVKDCNDTTEACADECIVGGPELESDCDTHVLDICRTTGFSIDEKALRTNVLTKEQLIATGMLKAMMRLDEYLAQQMVLKLDTFIGLNAYVGGKGVANGFETCVAPAFWNGSLFSYLMLVSQMNKFSNPYMLSGVNLFEAYFNAQANASNSDGKGLMNMFDTFRIYFDIFNIDTQLSPDQSTFLIDANAVAFVSKAYYNWSAGDQRAQQYGGPGGSVGAKWQVESKNLPGVFYDVTYKVECVGNEIKHHWTLSFKGGIFLNPVGCNLNNTGVLKFNCC